MAAAMNSDTILPRVEIAGELHCPHCGCKLFSWEDAFISKCPHLVFAFAWGDPDFFLAVRDDFARAFLRALLASPAYRNGLVEGELDPISEEDQLAFCKADFSPEDNAPTVIAAPDSTALMLLLCCPSKRNWRLPERRILRHRGPETAAIP